MKRLLLVAITSALLGCGPAFAQATTGTGVPLGITSPLGIGPGAPVGATGIPLGATELAAPGISPIAGGSAGSAMTATTCIGSPGQAATSGTEIQTAGISGAATETATSTGAPASAPTALFDGAGMSGGTASGTCATGSSGLTNSAASASSPDFASSSSSIGRAGIPIGATELNAGGLSPLPSIIQQSPAAGMSTGTAPCPATGATVTAGTSMSGGC